MYINVAPPVGLGGGQAQGKGQECSFNHNNFSTGSHWVNGFPHCMCCIIFHSNLWACSIPVFLNQCIGHCFYLEMTFTKLLVQLCVSQEANAFTLMTLIAKFHYEYYNKWWLLCTDDAAKQQDTGWAGLNKKKATLSSCLPVETTTMDIRYITCPPPALWANRPSN